MIVGSALVHAALLVLLFNARPATPAGSDVATMSVSLLDGNTPSVTKTVPTPKPAPAPIQRPPAPAKLEVEPVPPSDIEPQFIDVSLPEPDPDDRPAVDDAVALSVAAAASAAAGQACDLTQWLQKALQTDPQVQQALARIPRPARSVANAIMLWDGAWVAPPATATTDMAIIRRAVIVGIGAAPPACRDQLTRGPELFTLADTAGTTVVVVGSGVWRWADLLRDDPASSLVQAVLATVPTAKP